MPGYLLDSAKSAQQKIPLEFQREDLWSECLSGESIIDVEPGKRGQ